jgi:hypothetical protein
MGPILLQHISSENARSQGVIIRADAVVDGQHTFVLIVDAEDEAIVNDYMAPFAQAGTVEVMPASSCEQVVERAQC